MSITITKTKTTIVETNRRKYQYCRALIADVLGWSIDYLHELAHECGCEYVEISLPDYPGIQDDVKFTPGFFWPWFMNQWNLRDEEFVLTYNLEAFIDQTIATATREYLIKMYCEWHQEALTMDPMTDGFYKQLEKIIKQIRR